MFLKNSNFIYFSLILFLGVGTAQTTYTGEMSFNYSGSLNGEFQSGVEIDSLDGISANGAFAAISETDTMYSTIFTALAPADNETVDIFLIHKRIITSFS